MMASLQQIMSWKILFLLICLNIKNGQGASIKDVSVPPSATDKSTTTARTSITGNLSHELFTTTSMPPEFVDLTTSTNEINETISRDGGNRQIGDKYMKDIKISTRELEEINSTEEIKSSTAPATISVTTNLTREIFTTTSTPEKYSIELTTSAITINKTKAHPHRSIADKYAEDIRLSTREFEDMKSTEESKLPEDIKSTEILTAPEERKSTKEGASSEEMKSSVSKTLVTEMNLPMDKPVIDNLRDEINIEHPLIVTNTPLFAKVTTNVDIIPNKRNLSSSRLNSIEGDDKNLKNLAGNTFKNEKTKVKQMNYEFKSRSSFDPDTNHEIVSLKTKPSMFHAILRKAKESNNFEDPFGISSIIHDNFLKSSTMSSTSLNSFDLVDDGMTVNKTETQSVLVDVKHSTILSDASTTPQPENSTNLDISYTKISSSHPLEAATSTLQKASTNQTEKLKNISDKTFNSSDLMSKNLTKHELMKSGIHEDFTGFKTSTILRTEIILHRLDPEIVTIEKLSKVIDLDYLDQDSIVNELETLKEPSIKKRKEIVPIYDEISGPLHVDSSIDDIEEEDPKNPKITEDLNEYFPKINSSLVNIFEPDLKNGKDNQFQETTSTARITIQKQETTSTSSIDVLSLTSTPVTSIDTESSSRVFKHSPTTVNNVTQTISAHHALNSTRSNFVKDQVDLRIRPHDDEGAEVYDSVRLVGNQTNNSTAKESSYSNYGFNSNWNTKNKQKSPSMLLKHNQRVLEVQAAKMLQVMNLSVDPCDDFYEYACGKWSEVYPLKDKALDNTFDRLREGLDEVLKLLLEEPVLDNDTNATKAAKILYEGCMDEETIEDQGIYPLRKLLQDLGGWPALEGKSWNKSAFDWVELMAFLRTYNNDILLSEWVAADITNSSNHIIQIDQPQLGLPGREYFLSAGDDVYRKAYLDLMRKSCVLLGGDPKICLSQMTETLNFEIQLAKILTAAEERRNLSAVHQRLTVSGLEKEIPQINWKLYLRIVSGSNDTDRVVIYAMKYINKLVALIDNTKKRTVSNYLLWRFVKNRISNLGRNALEAKQEFIHVLFGRKTQPKRWVACVSYVNGNLGYAVGSLFVKRYFPESSKNDSEVMIELIRESFVEAIRNATWMTGSTRKVAEEKVMAMVRNVGYPQFILNDTYMNIVSSTLNFNASQHFLNVIQMLQFHAQSNHLLLSVSVNRTEWTTSPAVVNAYYSRSKNMIMFPAGILQPPFYHPAFPRSLNFGGIGVVIGHEISHGFDNRGRQFDAMGNLKQWWTEEDESQFYDKATCMLDQYGEYEVESIGLKINAVNTLAENIADNAGLKIAYKAYQRWKKQNGEETNRLPNIKLSFDQLFFLNFGQIWCEVNSPEAMLTKIRGGQHSPNRYRVIGTLSNSDEFNAAFNCPKGKKMNPDKKCHIW